MAQMRLDKFLGEMGVGTRSQVKEMARKGRITVNGRTEKRGEQKILPEQDIIQVDGKTVSYIRWEYYLLNKPQGTVSAREDGRYPTVVDLIGDKKRKDLFPVGRLDVDTEGLLLITNDGNLAHQLLSPKKHVDKTYFVRISGELSPSDCQKLREGLILEDGTKTLPAKLEILNRQADNRLVDNRPVGKRQEEKRQEENRPENCQEVLLTIHEGKFHQIKRMVEALGNRVVYLKRISMGPLSLDEKLKPGQYRPLTKEEVARLKALEGTGEEHA